MNAKNDEPGDSHVITRERLIDGSLAKAFRANAPAGYTLRSDDELAESLERMLADHPAGEDVYVFGYGSLMWNPAIEHAGMVPALVHGWSRRFCLRLFTGRGTPETPGVMLALDRGGSCHGLAIRLRAAHARHELSLLWRREMLSNSYNARWVSGRMDGRSARVLTFVVNRESPRYLDKPTQDELADLLLGGHGYLGSSHEYFTSTLARLRDIGVKDRALERLHRVLENRRRA